MQAQPLQLVAGEAEPDGAGHGLLGLPAAAAFGTRRPGVERRPELLTGAEQQCSGGFLGDREDGGDAGGAQTVHVVQQQRRAAAQVEGLERRLEAPARLARRPAPDAVRGGARDAGVERAAVGQGLQVGGAPSSRTARRRTTANVSVVAATAAASSPSSWRVKP